MKVIFLITSLDIFLLLSQIIMVKTFHTSLADFTYLMLVLNEQMHFLLSSHCLLEVLEVHNRNLWQNTSLFSYKNGGRRESFIYYCYFPLWALAYCGSAGKKTDYSIFPLFLHCLLNLALLYPYWSHGKLPC